MEMSQEDVEIVQCVMDYKREAEEAKRTRMDLNRDNFDVYHLNQDFSHKKKGQSQEFLAKQAMAVEQICSFMEQSLIDVGQFFKVEPAPGVKQSVMSVGEISQITLDQINKNNFHSFISDSLKLSLLGSLMIAKVHTQYENKPMYSVDFQIDENNKPKTTLKKITNRVKRLKLDLVRQENWFPDPTGSGLYQIEQIEMDLHDLVMMAKANPEAYNVKAVESLQSYIDEFSRNQKIRETNQDDAASHESRRKRVTIHECWGTILSRTGEVLYKDVVCAVANEQFLIRKPTKYPFWHGRPPYVSAPLIRVPKSVWHKALMDAPTKHNRALNEMYNLLFDSGMMSVHGIKQLRESWLDNPSQIEDGIPPGETLIVGTNCPPGAKVLERVDTANMSAEALQMFQLTNAEFQQASLVPDIRLGVLPDRAVKATEVVAANQNISGVFSGIARITEADYITAILEMAWLTICQIFSDMDRDELIATIGEDRFAQLQELSPEEIFASTVNGHRFKVFGISLTLNKVKEFKKLTGLLQTISGAPVLAQEFSRKYSFTKLLGEVIKSLDINEEKILVDSIEKQAQAAQQAQEGVPLPQQTIAAIANGGGGPDIQSQIPQALSEGLSDNQLVDRQNLNEGVTTPNGPQGNAE